MKAAAITCWALAAWICCVFIIIAWFAAAKGDARVARIEVATGLLGGAGFFLIGAWLW